jgi:uncharacterized surface protein with fasciclin (FAS1) repeats
MSDFNETTGTATLTRRGLFGLAAAVPLAMAFGADEAEARAADIVDTAAAAGQFRTLLAAATAAGLAPTLKGRGPFTVFAPTDAAFAALPAGTVQSLLRPENRATLRAILTYHVVAGRVRAADILGRRLHVTTVNGRQVDVNGRGGRVRVNRARVVQADIMARNGIIHVIDRVLMPPGH